MAVQSLTYPEFVRICEAYRGLPISLRTSSSLQHLLVENLSGIPLADTVGQLTELQMNILRQRLAVRCRPMPKPSRRRGKRRITSAQPQASMPNWKRS
jgi:hypothetical protein